MAKFTFKTNKPVGKYRIFQTPEHLIKYKRKVCGCINERNYNKFKIMFAVNKKDIDEDGNPNCKWKRIYVENEFDSLQSAKDFINNHTDKIVENLDLYLFEDWK